MLRYEEDLQAVLDLPDLEEGLFRCWACGVVVRKGTFEKHHFPIPKTKDGTEIIDLCTSCHDMVDRKRLDQWPFDWYKEALELAGKSRVGRLMLLKLHKILILSE